MTGPVPTEALVARVAELEAENAQITVERNEALAMRRWNIDRTGDGEVLVCRGYHDKGEDCDHERFVPEERLAAAEAALQQVTAERDEARAKQRDMHRRAQKAESFRQRHHGEVRWLFTSLRKERAARRTALATATSELARLRAEGEGTVAVPLEPTVGMQEDGLAALEAAIRTHGKPSLPGFAAAHVYRAMLAARPSTAKEGQADA